MDSNGPNNYLFMSKSLLLLLSSFLIYDFHATFDRGVKVRLFARHDAYHAGLG
jgi:hypothetical protein